MNPKEKRIQIGFVGGYGHDDIGDEAMLTSNLSHVRRLLPDARLIAFSDNPQKTADLHGLNSQLSTKRVLLSSLSAKVLHYAFSKMGLSKFGWRFIALVFAPWLLYNAKRLVKGKKTLFLSDGQQEHLESLLICKAVWNVGGGNLCSVYPEELYSKVLLYSICKIMEVPVFVTGQTIGPLTNSIDSWILRYGLDCVEMITTRDIEWSREIAKLCGVTKPEVLDGVDDAFDLEPISREEVEHIYSSLGVNTNRPVVAINLRFWPEIKEFIKSFAEFLDNISNLYDVNFVYIPTQYLGRNDDRLYGHMLKRAMQHRKRFYIAGEIYTDRILKGLIGQADLAIGVRYHFVVFAVTMGTPAIGFYYDMYYQYKHSGILEMMGLASAVCPATKAGLTKAEELVEDFFLNMGKWSQHITKHYQELLPKRQFTIEKVIEEICHT